MKKFKYYYKSDSNKESVGRINAGSLNEAIHISAKKKKLSLKKFLIIFEVEEINGGKN